MTRANFVRERKKNGRMAELGSSHTCENCRAWVERVSTRLEPHQFFIFNQGPSGELHHCQGKRADAR